MREEGEMTAWLGFLLLVLVLAIGMIIGVLIGSNYNSQRDFAEVHKIDTLHSKIN